jgi:type IV pili sensor histidine kinase/response regulator
VKLIAATLSVALGTLTSGCASWPDASVEPAAPIDTPLPLTQPPARAVVPATAPLSPTETQVGRYTSVSSQPAEADANPLAVIAKVHFPREVVHTVGEAVRYVLIRTGYQLVDESVLDARVKSVFALRLPDNQRVLGPYRVDTMLGTLMGPPYQLVADPTSRSVTYIAPPVPSGIPEAAASSAVGTGPR